VIYSIKLLACQARHINQYKKLKTKVLNCCASIYFNHHSSISFIINVSTSIKVIISKNKISGCEDYFT